MTETPTGAASGAAPRTLTGAAPGVGDRGEAGQDQLGGDDQHRESGQCRAEDGQAGGADEQADQGGDSGAAGRGGAHLPGDDVLGSPFPDASRGQGDQGREDPGQGSAEGREGDHGARRAGLPPNGRRSDHRQGGAEAHHGAGRDRAGHEGQGDPHGGQRAPVAERGQACRARGQVQMPAAEARLPLPGADLEAGVQEEHAHAGGQHCAVTAPGPLRARLRLDGLRVLGRPRNGTVAPTLAQPGAGDDQVEDGQGQVGRAPGASQDGGRHDQRADRRADAVGAVQQVEEPLPAGQRDRRVEPGVHHASRRAAQDGHAQHEAEPGCERVAGDAHCRAQSGHGQQGGHAKALDEGPDEHRDQYGSGRAEEQD